MKFHNFSDANHIPQNIDTVLVFGSNTLGIHGSGLARVAVTKFGAKQGKPKGLVGNSYGIITKELGAPKQPSVSKESVIFQIKDLYELATNRLGMTFYIPYTKTGSNRSGFSSDEIFEMFIEADFLHTIPPNVLFHESFK